MLQQTGKQLKLDIATIHVGKPCLIAEGHPDLESTKDFPLALMERGFSIDIAKAEATQEEDRRRILNSVAGKEEAELDTEPPTEHEKFTQVHTSSRKTPLVLMFQKQIEFSQEVIFVVLPSERNVTNCHEPGGLWRPDERGIFCNISCHIIIIQLYFVP